MNNVVDIVSEKDSQNDGAVKETQIDFMKTIEDKKNLKILEGKECVENMDYEGALIAFNKVLFYDKNMALVYAEKAEIYIKLCDFSSAIQ